VGVLFLGRGPGHMESGTVELRVFDMTWGSDLIGQMGSLRPRVGQGWPQVTHSHHSFTAGQPGVRSTNSLQLLAPKGISAFPTWDGSLHFADGHVDTPEDSCQWS
jgi:hypothetical protein